MLIFSGNSNRPLAESIAEYLQMRVGDARIRRFSDMEIFVEIQENVRGEDVFLVQSTSYPANDNLMELLVTMDALRRGSAKRITAVIPYYCYARQDRKTGPRTPISAKLVADLLTTAGADRVLTLDLHAGQIQGFFSIPVDNLFALPVFVRDIRERYAERRPIIVSPDVGGVVRARELAARLGTRLAIIDKRRDQANESSVMNIIGDVRGEDCIFLDDIVDTAGTMCNAAEALMEAGAASVSAYVTHGVLSNSATTKVEASPLERMIITDSIRATPEVEASITIEQVTVAPLLGEAMRRISEETSVSSLFH
jgi:ribose-phosphate pyrophosphokinase